MPPRSHGCCCLQETSVVPRLKPPRQQSASECCFVLCALLIKQQSHIGEPKCVLRYSAIYCLSRPSSGARTKTILRFFLSSISFESMLSREIGYQIVCPTSRRPVRSSINPTGRPSLINPYFSHNPVTWPSDNGRNEELFDCVSRSEKGEVSSREGSSL